MQARLTADVQKDSIVDGGLRGVIWFQGCSHNCDGCHNLSFHDFKGGFLYEDILKMGKDYLEFLQNIDVLVDGKFEKDRRYFYNSYKLYQ